MVPEKRDEHDLDLHHAPGFFFGNGAKNDLFTSEASRKRYLDIWRMFAERYSSEGDNLIFELLNEAGLGEFRPVERSLAGDGGGDTQDIAHAPDNCRRKLLEQRERVTKSRADRRRADNIHIPFLRAVHLHTFSARAGCRTWWRTKSRSRIRLSCLSTRISGETRRFLRS